jgi:hydroxymethylpyrimidine/phosphomethylpyrimidine kinase
LAPSHIKIGMTASAEIIATLADILTDFPGEIIFDPVLRSSAGQSLLGGDSAGALGPLLARVSVLTPNIPELSSLSRQAVSNEAQAIEAGQALMGRYGQIKALCIKGGHLHEENQEVVDILLEKTGPGDTTMQTTTVRHPRRQTLNSHGTGCTFASAFAAYHARLGTYPQAFEAAVSYVDSLLELSKDASIGQGSGPLQHYKWLAKAEYRILNV